MKDTIDTANSLEFEERSEGENRILIVKNWPQTLEAPYCFYAECRHVAEDKSIIHYIAGPATKNNFFNKDPQEAIDLTRELVETKYENHRRLVSQRISLREKILTSKLLGATDENIVTVTYDGYGDSGQIQECNLPESCPEHTEVQEYLWQLMWQLHSGFENNEGGQGTISWDLNEDKIVIDHEDNVVTTSQTVTEL
jgi:hypothetical protein